MAEKYGILIKTDASPRWLTYEDLGVGEGMVAGDSRDDLEIALGSMLAGLSGRVEIRKELAEEMRELYNSEFVDAGIKPPMTIVWSTSADINQGGLP